jgi:hypothetical protein
MFDTHHLYSASLHTFLNVMGASAGTMMQLKQHFYVLPQGKPPLVKPALKYGSKSLLPTQFDVSTPSAFERKVSREV